ncbi:MAG: homocysteine biosynthesis protein [Candidatus Omnitrophota bacterium]
MKTIKEINDKIKKGEVVVVTAEEVIELVEKKGAKAAAREVDVVTTGTFGPMCSSGAYFNIGHSKPKIKLGGGACKLNDVPCYTGFAAVDIYLGATAIPDDDPRNQVFPGEFKYGGAHVIQEIVAGRDIRLEATSYGTDCYPRKKLETFINIKDLNEAVLFNIRNCYQNYNVAVNLSDKMIYTYMGALKPDLGNANYCSAGQLSPLLKDPCYKTIGIGTKIFLGGGIGFVAWQGTQHNPAVPRKDNGIPQAPAGTLAVIGDLKQMKPEWLVGTRMLGYGVSLSVGIGVPIPILDEDTIKYAASRDEEIYTQIVDYGINYPEGLAGSLGEVNYAQLKSGKITVQGKAVPTGNLSSYSKAREIAEQLKSWIKKGDFLLTEPVAPLPGAGSGYAFKPLKERPII